MTPATYAVINLAALKHNASVVRRYAPESKVMAVIKANAYGHGLLAVAEALSDVDAVAVARVDEGVRLRRSGFNRAITVLEGFVCAQELDVLKQYDLDIVIHSDGQVRILEQYTGKHTFKVWLKLDSGMNRLGFKSAQFTMAYERLLACACVNKAIYFMTHLSNADDRSDRITSEQIARFKQSVRCYQGECSIANSAAIIAWSEALTDWVRPGIMLYGVSPFVETHGAHYGLQVVMSLYSRLIAVKKIKAGESVGYAGTWVSPVDTLLGVVAIGYGDGYPRHARSGTPVLVNGQRVPLVGRVSMDMVTVDLSTQPNAKPGDPVTLWGEALAVEEIARCADTIPYTLLCGITQRVNIRQF